VTDARRLAYLEALGVDVYVRRSLPPAPAASGSLPAIGTSAASPVPATPAPSALPAPEATLDWEALRAAVSACTRCALAETRTQTVFGVGNPRARWMFIGEAPGAEEDKRGEPFVGRAGQLLTAMLKAVGLRREDVYIANVLKCRPPGNRDPRPEEAAHCRGYLERQIELVAPALVIAVGRIAAQNLLATDAPLARLRGRVHALGSRGWPLVVTYHPAYLLRSPGEKRKAWQDLLFARQVSGRIERGEPVLP
jgi:DNA polymerase